MIQDLCNVIEDINLDTYYKAFIIEASQLPSFNYLTPDAEILGIVNSLPVEFQAMLIRFIPEKFNLASRTAIQNGNKIHKYSVSLPLVPQDENIQNLLETYNNKEVVVFITRHTHSVLYGTQAQPLLFTYDDLNANTLTGIKGYDLAMAGDGYGAAKLFAGSEAAFPVINRGLAFQLAGSL